MKNKVYPLSKYSSTQTSIVLKLYETNNVGLTSPEIAQIYEEEFSRLKKAKEADPWEQINPNSYFKFLFSRLPTLLFPPCTCFTIVFLFHYELNVG